MLQFYHTLFFPLSEQLGMCLLSLAQYEYYNNPCTHHTKHVWPEMTCILNFNAFKTIQQRGDECCAALSSPKHIKHTSLAICLKYYLKLLDFISDVLKIHALRIFALCVGINRCVCVFLVALLRFHQWYSFLD